MQLVRTHKGLGQAFLARLCSLWGYMVRSGGGVWYSEGVVAQATPLHFQDRVDNLVSRQRCSDESCYASGGVQTWHCNCQVVQAF